MSPPPALRQRLRSTWRLLLKEVSAFGVVGAAAFACDLVLFQVLYATAGVGAVTAKLTSTLVSTTVAFLGHRFWSFSHRSRTGLRRESLLFALVNGATLLLGLAIVALVRYPLGQEAALVLQVANVGSIALGTVIRFLAYRRWVFPARALPAAAPAREAAPAPAG
ncbi:GtrA family protein [Geodermatophilus marinus]|uniref:GtrA family protein n=1 Tax=Geodermatophilus sp. LHW52908 TaxID=2303986 RepID=UPI000E3CEBEB|nr:GtrA family protein [Geodermatophilus sp. LHW52908]RFU21727.1 GtrA family protein [Geodermatophilus sp. LHW52908]